MKKYLFGLGAMLVGAGLMFVLMHGEVSADSRPEKFVCSSNEEFGGILHCRVGNLSCGVLRSQGGVSCVKTGIL